ncbi:unconventional myosin-Va-like isoform X2 [Stylophora pistillata]|uniref:unconventional myosin-Va-like isoform X2 n=1 Tax=Stylophora pistillata TaxID=50429 RepID=UPI000C04E559|nr:unconventional myosin-Va-like isoform X2 [Stylophora pistillata]
MTTLELYTKGARVWIPHDQVIWIGGELTKDLKEDGILEIELEDGNEITLDVSKGKQNLPPLRNPEVLVGENDLTTLSYLHEPAVLYNLQVRFLQSNAIYTYCGIVLVAINPYQQLPLYGPDIISAYSGQSMGDMDPHIFAVAEDAFRAMARDGLNQSIIVSGESGAGKTVSAKYAMRYFASVGGASTETQVEKKVLASNPIMEAIGNAKTIRNDNSSRFGKYLEISFDKNYHIIAAHMRTYLLEKSRVVFQAPDERNYHIFYQLCAACDTPELKDLRLAHQDNFYYLNQGECAYVDEVDDAEGFEEMREAMDLVGIMNDEQLMIFRILAGILHIGNIDIQPESDEESTIDDKDFHLAVAADLLGIDRSQFKKWLCNRKIVTVQEVLIKPLNAEEADFGRKAISKHIYSQLFKWIVQCINNSLSSGVKQHSFLGILDIYGFETFEENSFEQFCINYANEKLQQQFTQHVFKLEQDEYVKEEIEWSFINFYDNQACIDLIEAKLGILDLLDEECKMPKGADSSWIQKLYKHHMKKEHFSKPRLSQTAFIVHHFADDVQYEIRGFVEKNRDSVNQEHLAILKASEYEMVGDLFTENEAHMMPRKRTTSRTGKNISKSKRSVGSEFRESLSKLMETLNSTVPHYIRCIKPNDRKAPFEFNPQRSIQQLRACGVLETVRISAAGYPSRWSYYEFFNRYRMLVKFEVINRRKPRATIELILKTYIKDPDKFQMGKTKIFFRAGQVAYLEKLRSDKLRDSCIMIQKNFRCWREHRLYLRMRRSAILIQAWVRGYLARRLAQDLREKKAAITIQRYYRGYVCRKQFVTIRAAVIIIQCFTRGMFARRLRMQLLHEAKTKIIQRCWRRYKARKNYRNYKKTIIYLQSCVRRMIARRELKQLKIEARSVEHYKKLNVGMENKIIHLQQRLDAQVKEKEQAMVAGRELEATRKELEHAKQWKGQFESTQSKMLELELVIKELREELNTVIVEKDETEERAKTEKEELEEINKRLREELTNLTEELAEKEAISDREVSLRDEIINQSLEAQRQQLLAEFEAERSNHQRVLRDYDRLEQRYQNLQDEMEIEKFSPVAKRESDGLITASGSENSLEDAVEREQQQNENAEAGMKNSKLVRGLRKRIRELEDKLLESEQVQANGDIPSITVETTSEQKLPSENQVMESEKFQQVLHEREQMEQEKSSLEQENKKINSELELLRKLVSQRNIDKEAEWNMINEKMDEISADREQIENEKNRLRDELVNMASVATDMQNAEELLQTNPDENAYVLQAKSLKKANNVLQNELQDLIQKEKELRAANEKLWKEKAQLQMGRGPSLSSMDGNFNKEVSRLVTENVELREQVEKLEAELEEYKKGGTTALTPFRGRAQSWRGEVEQKRRAQSFLSGQEPKAGKLVMRHAGLLRKSSHAHKEGDLLPPLPQLRQQKIRGMIEFSSEDEDKVIKFLITDMNPKSMADATPGLPAHILFMCIRHCDHVNDDRRMQSLLTSSINSIRKVVKKNPNNLDILAFWLANTSRLLHDMKQYSGDKAFQVHNTPEQNQHCLKNFDLTEYRQVLSDLAIHVYQDLVKCIWEAVQNMIVPGMLEYESIPGVSSSKPFGGRSKAHADITVKSITKMLSNFLAILNAHCVDPEIIKQVFRQLFYYIGANMMNNLLLRKDMCHWSRGMQIRFNLSQLEDWVRLNQLEGSGIVEALENVIQATQLLQVNKKTLEDVDAICEVCSSLNTLQVQKILSMYTPANEYEARVPSSVIRAVVERGHNKTDPMFLMTDTAYIYPFTLPFTPSAVSLDSLTIPDNLNLDFLRVV